MVSKLLAAIALAVLTASLSAAHAAAQAVPEAVPAGTMLNVTSVAAGNVHSCALLRSGRVRCWGDNSYGGLGDGSTTPRNRGVIVRNSAGTGPLTNVTAIAAGGFFTCALHTNRQVTCWGDNFSGQLGTGSTDLETHLPTVVSNESGESALQDVVQITAGGWSACARLASGQVRCWGANSANELGNGTDDDSNLPTPVTSPGGVEPLTGVTQIDSGLGHTCARLTSGRVVCWGDNSYGGLGDGTDGPHARPVEVSNGSGTGPLAGVRRVSAGGAFSCAVLADRTARCWGGGFAGQLGNGDTGAELLPVPVLTGTGGPPLGGIGTVDAGVGHACARLSNGQARCWGANEAGEIGTGTFTADPILFPRTVRGLRGADPLTGVAQLQTNSTHTCVRLSNSQARCWGENTDGQLGNGGFDPRPRPVRVFSYTGAG